MSSVSRTRATNLTGLIDIDALVEANLLRQKTKLNTATQKMKVEQYRQEQYREVITKSKTFYNKYCDILSTGNFFSSSTYNTTKYTSSNSNAVEATGSSTSNVTNYKVSVYQLASKASVTYSKDDINSGNVIEIDGEKFILKGVSNPEIAKNLNSDLINAGIKVNAKYSDLANNGLGGLVIENSAEGNINLDVKMLETTPKVQTLSYATTSGKYAVEISKSNLKDNNEITINGRKFTLNGSDEDTIVNNLKNDLAGSEFEVSYDKENGKMTIINSGDGNDENNIFSVAIEADGKNVLDKKADLNAGYEFKIKVSDLKQDEKKGININGQNFRLKYNEDGTINTADLNEQLSSKNIKAELSEDKTELILSSTKTGAASKFEAGISTYSEPTDNANGVKKDGTNLSATIKDGSNEYKIVDGKRPDGTAIVGNQITLDGTTFKFNDVTSGEVALTGKRDGTELKDKIVEFINDYNELLGHINGKLYEEYDRSYMPLTDEDKEGLSDSEIEKLEKKAQTGLLRNDSYLRSFSDDMKLTMTTMLEKSGLSLERIGISPVQDYSTQNGLFTIDEDKLLAAIEENPEEIQQLFAGSDGIITKLKDNLSEHATGTFSRLANKAGVANGVTANTNEMTKDIEQRKKQIANMQTMLKEKEDALYIRYSSLESSLASLQSQQSSLASYFQ